MLKPQIRNSQTLNVKKCKPIEITLHKKSMHGNFVGDQSKCEQNSTFSKDKSSREGLSRVRPLGQKQSNTIKSQLLNIKPIHRIQQTPTHHQIVVNPPTIRPTPLTTSHHHPSYISQQPFSPNHTPTLQQLSRLIRTDDYKRFVNQVITERDSNNGWSELARGKQEESEKSKSCVEGSEAVVAVGDGVVNRQKRDEQLEGMNSVRSKVKGIMKGFLRDGNSIVSKDLNNTQNQSHSSQASLTITHPSSTHTIPPSSPLTFSQPQVPTPSLLSLLQPQLKQPLLPTLTPTDYQHLSQRLQKCVQQISEIEKINGVERIVELESELMMVRDQRMRERERGERRVRELEGEVKRLRERERQREKEGEKERGQMSLLGGENNQGKKMVEEMGVQTDYDIDWTSKKDQHSSNPLQSLSTYQTTNQFPHLSASSHHSTHIPPYPHSSLQHDLSIIRRKYATLQQVLQSKRKQILNKDLIIQVLMRREIMERMQGRIDCKGGKQSEEGSVEEVVREMLVFVGGRLGWGEGREGNEGLGE